MAILGDNLWEEKAKIIVSQLNGTARPLALRGAREPLLARGRPGNGRTRRREPAAMEEAAGSEASFCLQKFTISDDSKDDYQYEEVPADDEFSLQGDDEDLSKALQTIQEQAEDAHILALQSVLTSEKSVSELPEAIDDFFCNFLVRFGMSRTLDCFQTEWYELVQRGVFTAKDTGLVPTVYTRNQQLEAENMCLKKDLENYKVAANKAKEAFLKMQRERDFHRMHHKRVVQEKNRLVCDIKRLKAHYASYEPVLKQLTEKYQTTLRQKMLTTLERDRALEQVTGLQATLENLESGCANQIPVTKANHECQRKKELGPTQKALQEARQQKNLGAKSSSYDPVKGAEKIGKRYPKDSEFPVDTQVNPYFVHAKEYTQPLKSGEYKLSNALKVHNLAVNCLVSHPRKDIVVTGSDDHLWKMWALPDGNIIMTGEGHTDWLSGCCFHPSGTQLVTSSRDTTVRIWDFSKHGCILTLEGHAHAVWDCSWHSCGDFVASASMDKTSKIWDVNSERCRYTMYGHKDSVNSIEFLQFSNTVLTSSADKTLSLWDARTGLRVYTFYGHLHSCNHATFNMKGDTIASCDSSGMMKLWDIRKSAPILSIDAGPHPAKQVIFDHSGRVVALASSDGSVKVLQLECGQLSSLRGHGGEVRSITFHHRAEQLLSGGADGTVCLWS
ncbi:sperm-associated antigen 16 protein [Falco biarmicus]|uniref:sperm-associated antigen 16 protein n=1 Tax=Falco biarmicus TaxID=345155 RepID=UPI0024BCE8CB|nr:sperm-associated antigen 16 protein [Falco biarmicus]